MGAHTECKARDCRVDTLRADETTLTGREIFDGKRIYSDVTWDRIRTLTRNSLEKVAESPESGGWETLYRDPADGRFWEQVFLQGHRQGGGPPTLRVISHEEASVKYGLDNSR